MLINTTELCLSNGNNQENLEEILWQSEFLTTKSWRCCRASKMRVSWNTCLPFSSTAWRGLFCPCTVYVGWWLAKTEPFPSVLFSHFCCSVFEDSDTCLIWLIQKYSSCACRRTILRGCCGTVHLQRSWGTLDSHFSISVPRYLLGNPPFA